MIRTVIHMDIEKLADVLKALGDPTRVQRNRGVNQSEAPHPFSGIHAISSVNRCREGCCCPSAARRGC